MKLFSKAYKEGLSLLPKNMLSKAAGRLTALRLPKRLVKSQIMAFSKFYGINLDEVARPLEDFGSLQEFFVRELKPGARVIDAHPDAIVSPCDGFWGQAGVVNDGELMQVKGKSYSLSSLLGDSDLARKLEGGTFATLYLSPKDYHRFHAPIDAVVTEAIHIPGHLFPVNPWAVQNIEDLFCVNERIVAILKADNDDEKLMCFVAVGATMVGKVRMRFDESLTTNDSSTPTRKPYDSPPALSKGAEVGHFEFGSTIVLVASRKLGCLEVKELGTSVVMGERIGAKG